jgi:hypothetical protein
MQAQMDIRFPILSKDDQNRVKEVKKAFLRKELTDIQVVSLFFNYFFNRLKPMYNGSSKASQIKKAIRNQRFGVVIPKLVNVLVNINTITDLEFSKEIGKKDPKIIFSSIQTVIDIILSKKGLMQAVIKQEINIRGLSTLLKWLAPIALLQTKKNMAKVKENDLKLIDELLTEMGF